MSKFLTSLFILGISLTALNSCNRGLNPEEAKKHGLLDQAIQGYEDQKKKTRDPEKRKDIAANLGELYFKTNNYNRAENSYREAIRDGAPNPIYHYKYAQVLKAREKYEDAIEQLEKYNELVPGQDGIGKEIELCTKAIEWKEQEIETRFQVEEERFLSDAQSHDYAPVITEDGLVFTSNREGSTGKTDSEWRPGMLQPDLYIAREQRGRKKGKLQKPTLLEEEGLINSGNSEGTAAFDPKGQTMYYTACNREYEKDGLKRNDSNCVIMEVRRKGKNWADPERMPFCKDSSKYIHYGQPALSEDGDRLYFSSNMPGGFGGKDIWMCTWVKRSKTWSDPINLGPTINTPKDEMYPHPYNGGLYFASNGHPGIGGLDMFVSSGRGNEWSEPENLLPPMNSGSDDFGIFFERDKRKVRRLGEMGYFSSNRDNSRGYDNIYSFNVVPLKFTVSGYVYNRETKEPIANSKVTLYNLDDTTDVFVTTDENGYYFMKLYGETDYELRPFKDRYEYLDPNPTVSTKGYKVSKDFERDMYLDPFRVEFELDILYDLDDAAIREDAANLLDSFALILNEHYYTVMELSSHTDCRATREYNKDLSQRRAESAVNYLISKGIERERLVAKGYGEDQLKNDCECENGRGKGRTEDCTEDMHQENRRTEIRILSWDYEPKREIDEGQEYIDIDELREQELKEIEGEGEEEDE